MKTGVFVLDYNRASIPTDDTMYDCMDCIDKGITHKIERKPGPPGRGNAVSLPGCATTIRVCSGCGRYDGPWVPAPY